MTATLARAERESLADLLASVGPDAPTLCGTWTTSDLAAHLVLRERRPDAALGVILPPLAGYTESVQTSLASQPWSDLVQAVRSGPARWMPNSLSRVDTEMNTVEFFVHHEDVRRAADGWEPRTLEAEATAELWPRMKRMAGLVTRRSPVGIVAVPTDGPDAGRRVEVKAGEPAVVLTGPSSEVALALFGRREVRLEASGTDADIEAFYSFPR